MLLYFQYVTIFVNLHGPLKVEITNEHILRFSTERIMLLYLDNWINNIDPTNIHINFSTLSPVVLTLMLKELL